MTGPQPARESDATPEFDKARDVDVLGDELVYDGFFKIRKLRLRHRLFAGGWSPTVSRELFQRHEAVGVLLYDPVLDVVGLVQQFRIGTLGRSDNPWLLELVAGLIDADESPETVGIRETLEEAGCTVQALEPVCRYFSSPGGSDEYFHLFCGRCDLSVAGGIHGLADEGEDIRVRVLSAAEAFALLARGEVHNAHTLIGLLWLQQHRARLRSEWQ